MNKQTYIQAPAPQAVALERSVLGILLNEGGMVAQVMEHLSPGSFYTPAHALIYNHICVLEKKGYPTDPITLTEQLRTAGKLDEVGGVPYLHELVSRHASIAPLIHHTLMLKEKHLKREQLRIAGALHEKAHSSEDVFDTFEQIEQQLFDLSGQQAGSRLSSIARVADKVVRDIEEARYAEYALTGMPTGFRELDDKTNGWQPTDLIIIAARPGVGKTAFSLNLAMNCANDLLKPRAVALFDLEMQDTQVVKRGISALSHIPLAHLNRPKEMSDTELQSIRNAAKQLKGIPLYVEDTPAITTMQLRSKVRRYISQHGIGLVIIDYLQLIGSDRRADNREQEVSQVSRDLKRIAKELKVPIIALSQLNRDIERRANKEPTLADLRESGAIEQDADMILFLYPPSEEAIKEDADKADKVLLSCKKHRNGELFDTLLQFNKKIQLFSDVVDSSGFPVELGNAYKGMKWGF